MSESRHAHIVQPEGEGRRWIAVIGIDEYRHAVKLTNAVSDASGALHEFEKLGYELAVPPLLDGNATQHAIEDLVRKDLARLSPLDSLIVFFAGHGNTRRHRAGVREITTGYLLPSDADDDPSTWIDVDAWLRRISKLPPRHILVVLDACYSGIALSASIRWGRDGGQLPSLPFPELHARQSRLVITSAQDNQIAADSGPKPGHSLFTGCLIDAVTGGVTGRLEYGAQYITGTQLAVWVQHRVRSYPGVQGGQTPGFGVFDLDDRGEMLIPIRAMDDAITSTAIPLADYVERPERGSQGEIYGQMMPGTEPRRVAAQLETIWLHAGPTRTKRRERWRRGALVLAGFASVLLGVGAGLRVTSEDDAPRHSATATRVERSPMPPPTSASSISTGATPAPGESPSKPSPSKPSVPSTPSPAPRKPAPTPPSPGASPRSPSVAPAGQCVMPFETNPPGAEIVIRGQRHGTTPTSLALPCGVELTVALEKPLYVAVTRAVTPTPQAKRVYAVLKHQTVRMYVTSTPADVAVSFVDFPWWRTHYTPGDMNIYVAKTLRVRFARAGYETVIRDIVPVQDGRIHVDLKKLSP